MCGAADANAIDLNERLLKMLLPYYAHFFACEMNNKKNYKLVLTYIPTFKFVFAFSFRYFKGVIDKNVLN